MQPRASVRGEWRAEPLTYPADRIPSRVQRMCAERMTRLGDLFAMADSLRDAPPSAPDAPPASDAACSLILSILQPSVDMADSIRLEACPVGGVIAFVQCGPEQIAVHALPSGLLAMQGGMVQDDYLREPWVVSDLLIRSLRDARAR